MRTGSGEPVRRGTDSCKAAPANAHAAPTPWNRNGWNPHMRMQLGTLDKFTMTVVMCIPSCPMSEASSCQEKLACWESSCKRKCMARMHLPCGCGGVGASGLRRESGSLRATRTASTNARTSGCRAKTKSHFVLPETRTVLRCSTGTIKKVVCL